MTEIDNSLLKVVNASGFVFQLRVENEIQEHCKASKWQVIREHCWADPDSGREGFIDLVLIQSQTGTRIAIECKRVRDGNWIFLVEENLKEGLERARLLWTIQEPNRRAANWDDFFAAPQSMQSAFCVIRGQGEKDTSMLERLCAVLLYSLEALAHEEFELASTGNILRRPWVYVPVIVTTAELKVCHVILDKIDLETGQLSEAGAHFETVPFLRFRKGLATSLVPPKKPDDLQDANWQNERTVFVVNAKQITEFLNQFELIKSNLDWPWGRYFASMQ